jgi:predicted membrane protein
MSLFVKILFLFLFVAVLLFMGLISYLEVLSTQDGGYEKGNGKKIGKILKKLFIRRFLDIVASFGLIFFIVSHFYCTPIVCCMRRHNKKVREKTEKRKLVDVRDYSFRFSWSKGFARKKVFAT